MDKLRVYMQFQFKSKARDTLLDSVGMEGRSEPNKSRKSLHKIAAKSKGRHKNKAEVGKKLNIAFFPQTVKNDADLTIIQ